MSLNLDGLLIALLALELRQNLDFDSDDDSSEVRTLYHQTSPEAAEAILRSQKMNRGSDGLAGGGIYFAETKADTYRKARNHGVILKADVTVGNAKEIDRNGQDNSYWNLKRQGYDSVTIPRHNGREWVVYNHAQVKNIRRA
mmetsp:Transcript_6085/g.9439  ORF Transcript_6085/g.9439 Transcript_6085/m.9439 type:complete len:142 (+) Transcript_6085:184-609(+)|eukprot:CAMPEP_0175108328 /NCGR_PEP_ID=MMETSP0086_2-20121207/12568_1 /TAXON_ID=136419 /ORGANISM="Unknown Unknown, Strain D1" /LENGTH=141 /DNA_ID=CAMNT_0016385511 /DNA_START=179 /DNA_END=604 /DNA_ORIENTATION=+